MFYVHSKTVAASEVMAYIKPKTAGDCPFGTALKLTENGLEKCGATELPQFISRGSVQPDGLLPAGMVTSEILYEVPYTAKPTVGKSVQLSSDAAQVTATTGGAFFVLWVNEDTKTAVGRFERSQAGA